MSETASPQGVTTAEWDAWTSFLSMRRQLELALEHQLQRDADISVADYGILLSLSQAEGNQLRAGELAQQLAWEKSRVSHQVSRMEKRGLVERRLCDVDARGTWVGLTESGNSAVLGAMRDHATTMRQYFFDVVTPEELAALKAASDRVLESLDVPASDV
jgi:DNA-binding MarR family transcriptional regulator